MSLHLGQLIYTSFADVGLKVLRSDSISKEIEQIFLHKIVFRYWNSYKPPLPNYRAAYVLQLSPEQTLFGWLYNDGCDDLGRSHLPYFISYYLEELLLNAQLDHLLLCLQKGPVLGVSQQDPVMTLEDLEIADFGYQSFRPGVSLSTKVRRYSYSALRNQQLLDLYIPGVENQPKVTNKSGVVSSVAKISKRQYGAKSVPTQQQATPPKAAFRRLNQTKAGSANFSSSSAREKTKDNQVQILLGVGLVATTLALTGLIYFFQANVFTPKKLEQKPVSGELFLLTEIGLFSLSPSNERAARALQAPRDRQNRFIPLSIALFSSRRQ